MTATITDAILHAQLQHTLDGTPWKSLGGNWVKRRCWFTRALQLPKRAIWAPMKSFSVWCHPRLGLIRLR